MPKVEVADSATLSLALVAQANASDKELGAVVERLVAQDRPLALSAKVLGSWSNWWAERAVAATKATESICQGLESQKNLRHRRPLVRLPCPVSKWEIGFLTLNLEKGPWPKSSVKAIRVLYNIQFEKISGKKLLDPRYAKLVLVEGTN